MHFGLLNLLNNKLLLHKTNSFDEIFMYIKITILQFPVIS